MLLEIEAVYENGTLKLDRDVPLTNGQRVKLTIHPPGARDRSGGFRWKGRREDLDHLILSDDNGLMESP